MRLQPEPGVGEVDRVDLGADVEQPAVVGLAHVAEQLHDPRHGPGLTRRPCHDGEAVARHPAEPAFQRALVAADRVEGQARQRIAQLPPPGLDPVPQPARGLALDLVVPVRPQPAGREARRVVLGREHRLKSLAVGGRLGAGEAQVGRQVQDVEQALAVAGVAAALVLAVVAEPDGVEVAAGAVGPADAGGPAAFLDRGAHDHRHGAALPATCRARPCSAGGAGANPYRGIPGAPCAAPQKGSTFPRLSASFRFPPRGARECSRARPGGHNDRRGP